MGDFLGGLGGGGGGTAAAIIMAAVAVLGLIGTYFGFILRTEHRLTKLETAFGQVPFSEMVKLMQAMLNKIPPATLGNPYSRRDELMNKLARQDLNYNEAGELRNLVAHDVESSDQDESWKAIALVVLGLLLAYVLTRPREEARR
jgi:hypothetical protein